jgi:hypothetical protein
MEEVRVQHAEGQGTAAMEAALRGEGFAPFRWATRPATTTRRTVTTTTR